MEIKKNEMIKKLIMSKSGKKMRSVQGYKCINGHVLKVGLESGFSDSFIEHVVFIYLHCMSLNVTVDIIRETYEQDILSKTQVLRFVEQTAGGYPIN